jgi:2-methylisocitrate lyase-like PEP mutase family enzyme
MNAAEQQRRAVAFRALHEQPGAFVVPNPWDAGTAHVLAGLGFSALATTSAGLSHSLGRPDGARRVSRAETLDNAHTIAAATPLPVTADLENGFGDTPEAVAETIRMAAAAGLVGGSVEDTTGHPDAPLHPFDVAVERVAAAAEAAKGLDFPFTLTARADNFMHGNPDLKDTIRRLRAFEAAGADVLFAPGLPDAESVRTVCSAVGLPVNVLVNPRIGASLKEYAAMGARRISLGSALSRTALGAFLGAAREIREQGTFTFAAGALPYGEANRLMADGDGGA